MQDSSIFRTIEIEFMIDIFVEEFILEVIIKTPVIFGNVVDTKTGVEFDPFFSNTTDDLFVSETTPLVFVVFEFSVSNK